MSKKFIAAVLAVSTTLATFSAAPARAASEEDIAKILGAAATLFIISKAIENNRDRDGKKKTTVKKTVKPQVKTYQQKSFPTVVPRQTKPRHHALTPLPKRCVRHITGGKVKRVVMGRCLARNYTSARPLPRACRMTVATQRGNRGAYALPCLRHRGYTIARN